MLDLVQPPSSHRRASGEHRLARADEAEWRISLPEGAEWGAPGYGFQAWTASKAAAVMAMRIMKRLSRGCR